jgi:hypothetical protein
MTFRIGTPHRRNAGNLNMTTGGERSQQVEDDIQTCPHCQSVIRLSQWKQEGGFCRKCMKPICNNPDCVKRTAELGCVPFTQALEQEWRLQGKLQAFRKLAGLDPQAPTQSRVITAER